MDYANQLKYRQGFYDKNTNYSTYQIFHKSHAYLGAFMREISLATSENQIRESLEKHLGVKGPFAKEYARKIFNFSLSKGGKLGIDRISEHSRMRFENIPKVPSESFEK